MRQIPETPQKCVLAARKSLKILLLYFWIHGLGLISRFGPRCNRRSQIFVSVLLAIFFEGNMSYLAYSMLIKFEVSDTNSLVRMAVILTYHALALLQRYFLYSRNAAVNEVLGRMLRVYSRIPNDSPPPDFRFALLTLIMASDILLILIITLLLSTFAQNPLQGLMEKSFSSISWVRFEYACIFFKNTGHMASLYFAFVCLVLKGAFSQIGHVPCGNIPERNRLVATYNELVDITKSASQAFHPVILETLVECLINVFHQLFNLFYSRPESVGHSAYRFLMALFNYMRFVLVCVSASSATGAAHDAKYRIREFSAAKWTGEVPKLSKHHPAFTLLDSIAVHRSLVLTASGILLTYGVMIATFSESSKNH